MIWLAQYSLSMGKYWARLSSPGLPIFFYDPSHCTIFARRKAGAPHSARRLQHRCMWLNPCEPPTKQPRQPRPGALAVSARSISLTFQTADGEVEALSNVDLDIAEGDFVSFIGPSGCGKTTLLRVIADLERPTAGTILINGVTPEQARVHRHYGYIFQAPALYPWRTIERNVMLPLEIMGFDATERRKRVEQYLKLVNLSGFERKYPWQLSGGMQQRASIARALSFEPALLLMDEPFGALDEIVRDHLNEQLLRLWNQTGKRSCSSPTRFPKPCSCRPRSS